MLHSEIATAANSREATAVFPLIHVDGRGSSDQVYEDQEELALFLLDLIIHQQLHGGKYDCLPGILSKTSGARLF